MSPLKPDGWKQYPGRVPGWGRELHYPWRDLTVRNILPLPLPIPSTLAAAICEAPRWPCRSTRTKQGKYAVNQALPRAFGSMNNKKKED